ncbi:MAG: TonB-dependent receptor [Proteobacteria bacterium]|nr:TonB-dependent receptor [Pseudomonadota bacterium]
MGPVSEESNEAYGGCREQEGRDPDTPQQLRPSITYDINTPNVLRASSGEPNLRPFTANNFDLSFEWYYEDASYLSLAGFIKQVGNFIVERVEKQTFNLASGPYIYDIRRPSNGEAANVRGVELSWQHDFRRLPAPFDGIGVQANLTLVDSNAKVELDNVTETFALEGLSNTRNLVLYYDKGALQLRAALNQRGDFLESISGRGGEPVFVEGYTQIDLCGSFAITENFTGFFQAINVTDARIRKHGRFANHFLELKDTGARYALGIRATF